MHIEWHQVSVKARTEILLEVVFKREDRNWIRNHLSKPHTDYVGRVCPAAGCKTNFQICIEVTVATVHTTRNLVKFQHAPAGHTRPTYTVCSLL
jgi:hypothetical protein